MLAAVKNPGRSHCDRKRLLRQFYRVEFVSETRRVSYPVSIHLQEFADDFTGARRWQAPLKALALRWGSGSFRSSAMADDDGSVARPVQQRARPSRPPWPELGTLGYGPRPLPGLPGLWSWVSSGLRLRRRRPGRRRRRWLSLLRRPRLSPPRPRLRRIGGITPFPYYGGPGYPSPGHPNYFGGVGPLVADQPVVTIGSDRGDPGDASGYGPFTGALPYPDTFFAPFTATAAAGGSSSGVSSSYPSTPATTTAPAPDSANHGFHPSGDGRDRQIARSRPRSRDRRGAGRRRRRCAGDESLQGLFRERGGEGRSSCRRRDPLDQRLPHHSSAATWRGSSPMRRPTTSSR